MVMKKVRFVGLNKDVWIPEDIDVIIDIVPSWRTNIRSNQIFTGQTYTTWHDTGNPNSDAWGERNWLHSGAGGASVGYNFAFDGQRIIQLTPLNEVTWAAGTANGNKFSYHAEQCLNTDWNRALYVGAALHGGLCAANGWDVDKALVQHNVWYGKHCPAQIRNKGLWPNVVQMVKDAKARALAAAGGTEVPQYAAPSPIAELADFDDTNAPIFVSLADDTLAYYVGYDVKAIATTPRLRWAYASAPRIGPDIPKDSVFRVRWLIFAADQNHYFITPYWTRVKVSDMVRV
jgi:hypothetical protein